MSSKAGNRFDGVDFGVLYFGSTLHVCFGETLARKRPDPVLARLVEQDWRDRRFMEIGSIPRDWRDRRSAVKVRLPDGGMPYLDVEHPVTHEFLRRELALGLAALGQDDLNVGVVRGPDRRVTRLISSWAWAHGYAGVRYLSKLDSSWECWAVFWDVELAQVETRPITRDLAELVDVANHYGLTIH